MRYALALLWSLAAACGMYAAAAVVWSTLDPEGAGRVLLFTIPIAVVAMAVCALVATVLLMLPFPAREGGSRERRRPTDRRAEAGAPAAEDPQDLALA